MNINNMLKVSCFNKTSLKESEIEATLHDEELQGILIGEIDISTLCQDILAITKSKLAAVITSTTDNPFNIVYSTNPGISFCQHLPILATTATTVISNSVEEDPRNIGHNLGQCAIKKLCSIPIVKDNTVYGKIILANRKKGYSINTLSTILRQISLISTIVISNDDNMLVSCKKNSELVFLSTISHEMKTPLHGIFNMIALLPTVGTLNEKQQKYISFALSSCEDLVELISDAIDYQKIKNNTLGIQNDTFNLREMITKTIELVRFKAEQKGLTVELSIGEKVPDQVYGDKDKLRQVLINIIGNAIKFTGKGGIIIKVEQYPARIIFTIQDTGCGIKKENLENVFIEYFQEEKYSKNGIGLGLSLSKKLVQMMGGGISVVSKYGHGSTFTIDLPLAQERYKLEMSSSDDEDLSVLIVDPLDNNRITLRKFLRQWKIHVDTSSTFKESRKIIEDDRYNVVIINPISNIGEAVLFTRYMEEKYPDSRIVCIGEADNINLHFDAVISNINDKEQVYNALLSVKKLRRKSVGTLLRGDIKNYKVCVVEDDQVSAFALHEILVNLGVADKNIVVIDNGEQAIRNIIHTKYDIVFMDCKLNGDLSGIDCTKIIKENSIYIKIIGVTASVTEDEKSTWLNSGLDGLIIKPFSSDAIKNVL